MPLEDEFGDVIGKARRGHGLSPAAVASAVGVTEDALAAMESYERLPTRDEVGQFARLFALPADRLWDIATEAWDAPPVPLTTAPPASLRIECVTLPYPVHCFLVAAADDSCLVIDTGTEAGPLLAKIRETGWQVAAILITHGHGDHTGGLTAVQRATGAPVYIGAADASAAAHLPSDAVHHLDTDRQLSWGSLAGQSRTTDSHMMCGSGQPLAAEAIPTPGHTPGSISYLIGGAAFVGDTMFAGSAGGTRSPAAYQDILRSVRERLLQLPPETPVFPAHGPATTIANERARNPFA